jgi:DNA-binding transcriptional ArsR family regulator
MATTNDTKSDSEPYAEHTALTELLGDHPKVKILAALLSEGHDINVSQIADLAGTSRSTVYNHIDGLIELNVVEHTRDVGGSPMYRINRDSAVATKLAQLEWDLLDEFDDE